LSAGALPQTPLTKLTELPRPPSWFGGGDGTPPEGKGIKMDGDKTGGKMGKGEKMEMEKRKGEDPPFTPSQAKPSGSASSMNASNVLINLQCAEFPPTLPFPHHRGTKTPI